ncbi:MAG: methyltransferase domain-containing protein [Ignavibacteriales bacterium]|nr:methyltransferase domain-containing protein [Ignavibacteriales bacterium]
MKQLIRTLLKPLAPYIRRLIGDHPVPLEQMPDSPMLFRMYRDYLLTGHSRVPGGWMYGKEYYPDYITVGGNSLAIQRVALEYCKGKGIDVGASFWPLKGATPVDIASGAGVANRIEDIPAESQNFVFSSHCLEHIAEWETAIDEWIGKLKKGGTLFLYLPHPECKLWHRSNPLMADLHAWTPTPAIIAKALTKRNMKIVARDDGPDHFFSFYVCARKR